MNLLILVIEFINLVENYTMRLFKEIGKGEVLLFVALIAAGSYQYLKSDEKFTKYENPSKLKEIKSEETKEYSFDEVTIPNGGLAYHKKNMTTVTGTVIKKHSNGKIAEKIVLKNGLRNGNWSQWWSNGQLEYESECKDGMVHGRTRYWYKNGQLKLSAFYKNNERNGLGETWYENGQLQGQIWYVDDKAQNIGKKWHENGQLNAEVTYSDGVIIRRKLWDKFGNKIQ